MAGFSRAQRQRIIDDYLVETRRNMFIPAEFVDWLAAQPEHEMYGVFFGRDDATLAREYRVAMARSMANGLRIVVRQSELQDAAVVRVDQFPAYLSPMDSRRFGGGYIAVDPDDPAHVSELRRQGIAAMRSWIDRYAGAFGAEATPIRDWIAEVDSRVVDVA